MAIKREAQGRVIVGEVTPGNDYKGLAGQRNLYIQLTADGATEESIDALNYLMDYAVYNNSTGKPIMPPDVNVWISNNGKTSAVEADDLSLEDGVYTICGIKCTNGTWDFSDAGQSGGGSGGGGGGLLVHINFPENPEEPATLDKNWNEINAVVQSGISPVFIANGVIYTCIEVIYDNAYIVTLVDLADGSARVLLFVADSATGVLTYAPEL